MAFSKTYPREVPGTTSPKWEEVFLTAQEEREREQVARQENIYLVRQCIADARNLVKAEDLKETQSAVLNVAMNLFKKRSSHVVFYKEEKCKQKFQSFFGVLDDLKEGRKKKAKS
ncbi:hypothetical protein ACFL0V_00835 [Nanoarchaeota archaeon]